MRVTDFTRSALAYRRQKRELEAKGYLLCKEPCWQLHRGGSTRLKIVDAIPSVDGKSIYFKLDGAMDRESAEGYR